MRVHLPFRPSPHGLPRPGAVWGVPALRMLALALTLCAGTGSAHAQYIAGGELARLHPPILLGHWIGVLPTRCGTRRAATDVELTLWSGRGVLPEGTYRLVETCRLPGLVPRVTQGPWVRLRDTDVVQLTGNGRLDTRSFLRLADGALRPLDRDLAPRWNEVLSPVE